MVIYAAIVNTSVARMFLGGFIPGVDHYVPPDVPWEHFAYYRQQLTKIL